MCHTSWMWADACFREETLYAIHHGCEQMHASGRKPYVPFIMDVSRCMLQGENFMCHTSWMWADACFREKTFCAIHHGCEQMHASGRKLYVPFIISVSTPITSENKCVMLHVVGLESPNIFKGHCYYFTSIHVIHCGCNYSHTIHSHLWKKHECGHTHNTLAGMLLKCLWKPKGTQDALCVCFKVTWWRLRTILLISLSSSKFWTGTIKTTG